MIFNSIVISFILTGVGIISNSLVQDRGFVTQKNKDNVEWPLCTGSTSTIKTGVKATPLHKFEFNVEENIKEAQVLTTVFLDGRNSGVTTSRVIDKDIMYELEEYPQDMGMDKKFPKDSQDVTRLTPNQTRIVGGSVASINQYPYMAQVVLITKVGPAIFCGGTLISHSHVLTAGHCVTLSSGQLAKPRNIKIRLGASNISYGGESTSANRVYRHPMYQPLSSRMNGAAVYDMAVLKLRSSIKFSDSVAPVTLATEGDTEKLSKMAFMNWPCKVVGWGWTKPGLKLDASEEENTLSKELLVTTVNLVDWAECRTIVPILEMNAELCCSSPHMTSGCKGDSGGPLLCEDNKEYGLVSRGTGAGCGIPNFPYIYTRVDTLYKYIEEVVKSI